MSSTDQLVGDRDMQSLTLAQTNYKNISKILQALVNCLKIMHRSNV